MPYNYSKLRGKIKEVCGSESKFAEAMGNMNRATLSLKLNGKTEWSQQEMYKALEVLNEDISMVSQYFFYKQC